MDPYFMMKLFQWSPLPIVVAQWVGVIGLAKGGREVAWYCMATGAGISTFFLLIQLLISVGGMVAPAAINSFQNFGQGIMLALFSLSSLGTLTFFIGFALHGMQAAKSRQRASELEAIAAARGNGNERLPDPYDTTR